MKTIAERLKEGMELRGMKQADLVRITGISKGSLSSYLSGRYAPKRDGLFKLAAALNVSDEWLMGADVPMQRTPSFYSSEQDDFVDGPRPVSDLFPQRAAEALWRKDIEEYLELLHKDPRYRALLDSSSKLSDEALDSLVKFIDGLNPDN